MTVSALELLNQPRAWKDWLMASRIEDASQARGCVESWQTLGIPSELLACLLERLPAALSSTVDPSGCLENLTRFLQASRAPHEMASHLERDNESLATLLRVFSVSPYLASRVVADPDSFELLRMTDGKPVDRDVLVDEICSEMAASRDEATTLRILKWYRRREILRIAFSDFVCQMPLDRVMEQNSYLAEAICEAALQSAWRWAAARHGEPETSDGQKARLAVIATGRLGGRELSYGGDIALTMIAPLHGRTCGPRSIPNREFFERVAGTMVKWISHPDLGSEAYRVDLRLRPHGQEGPLVADPEEALHYFDTKGRTWERQAFVKARSIAGDRPWADQWLNRLQAWVYGRYLSRVDLSGIRALKRGVEERSRQQGDASFDIVSGNGGIRDIEFVVQFLQLLNGCDWEPVRLVHSLEALTTLEKMGCLTPRERTTLEDNYRFLRRIEHCLQIQADLENHALPLGAQELRGLALKAGYTDTNLSSAQERFQKDLNQATTLNRKILDHLLHDAFGDDHAIADEAYLILDPEPTPQRIEKVLGPYGFPNPASAYGILQKLAREDVAFLSTRRCRHFLAAIAQRLLVEIASTPDPESTLSNMDRVSHSLGGKALLWELFSYHAPSMHLGVRLCAASSYLVGILTSQPGMIDELMDSLMLDRLPGLPQMQNQLTELCRGAEDVEPIIQSFKHTMHLQVGVRDILGKDDITATHRALAELAEVCLDQIISREYQRLLQRYGIPSPDPRHSDNPGSATELVVVALGKLGGREPNYHSDWELLFLYDAPGTTRSPIPGVRHDPISNQQFFNQLASRVNQAILRMNPTSRILEKGDATRTTAAWGPAGIPVFGFQEFESYFQQPTESLGLHFGLCKARPIWGSKGARAQATELMSRLMQVQLEASWVFAALARQRRELLPGATDQNLKRGQGGTLDVEYLVQAYQIAHAAQHPGILVPGTLEAIERLQQGQLLPETDARLLHRGYHWLRRIESGLRLMNTAARHDLPTDSTGLSRLAYLVQCDSGEEVQAACQRARQDIHRVYEHWMERA
jgi:glutamate-ammonia-ligase adenylyltransferase